MFDNCLYFNTSALARQLEKIWGDAFKPFDLTPSQGFMLRAILAKPGLLQCDVATILKISRPTVTRILDGLQEKKYIERRRLEKDRREWAIFPTPNATALKDVLNKRSTAIANRIKTIFGNEEFVDFVEKIKGLYLSLD